MVKNILVLLFLLVSTNAFGTFGSDDRGISTPIGDIIFDAETGRTKVIGSFQVEGSDKTSRPCNIMTTIQRDALDESELTEASCIYNSDVNQLQVYNTEIDDWDDAGGGGLDKWQAGELYRIDAVVWLEDDGKIYVATNEHTSTEPFDASNWFELNQSNSDLNNHMPDPSFELGVNQVSVSNATATQIDGGTHGDKFLRCESTAPGGYCRVTLDLNEISTSINQLSDMQGVNTPIKCRVRSSTNDTKFRTLRDGNVINEKTIGETDKFFTLWGQVVSGTNSVSFDVFHESLGSQVDVDDCLISIGGKLQKFESVFRKTVEIDLAGSGDFTGGTIRVSRNGDDVTISALSLPTHSTLLTATTGAIVPDWARPSEIISNVYITGTDEVVRVSVSSSGIIDTEYRNYSGVLTSRTNSGNGLSVSYNVNDVNSRPQSFASMESTDFKVQTKTLSSNVTTLGVMSELTFEKLEPGGLYEVVLTPLTQPANVSNNRKYTRIRVVHNSNNIATWAHDTEDTIRGQFGSSTVRKFVAQDTSLTFNVDQLTNMEILAETSVQLIKLPNTANMLLEFSDVLKYDKAGAMIGGYASFGGATDGSVCSTSPCTRYQEVGELGGGVSATRFSEGIYIVEVNGFKPSSPVFCEGVATKDGDNARPVVPAGNQLSDSSGVLTRNFVTRTLNHASEVDTYFTIKCVGLKP